MVSRIFDTIAPTWLEDVALGSSFEFGLAFHVTADQFLTELSWYRSNNDGSANLPQRLRLWDAVTGGTVYEAAIIPDNGSVGWQRHTPGVQITLSAGRVYRVAAGWGAGTKETYANSGTGSPSSPIVLESTYRYYNSGFGFPNTSPFGSTWIGVDVGVDSTPPAGTSPPNPGTTSSAELANWLITTGDNQHQSDGLPWRTDANVTDVKTLATDQLNHAGGLQDLSDQAVNLLNRLSNWLAGSTGIGTPSAVKKASGVTALDELDSLLADTATILADLNASSTLAGARYGIPAFPGGFALADETDFTDSIAYAQAADLYVVHITTPPPAMATDDFAGLNFYYRIGSYVILNGTHAVDARRFLEFELTEVTDQGRRMPGIALRCKVGTAGHIQAWLLT